MDYGFSLSLAVVVLLVIGVGALLHAACQGNASHASQKPEELAEMGRIAVRLGVGPAIVEQTLAASAHPLD